MKHIETKVVKVNKENPEKETIKEYGDRKEGYESVERVQERHVP